METPKLTRADAGSMGGFVTRDRHGPEFFSRIGRMGGHARKKKKIEIDSSAMPYSHKTDEPGN